MKGQDNKMKLWRSRVCTRQNSMPYILYRANS